MKKLFVLSLVILMLALSVVPAFAKGPGPANNGSANGTCTGTQVGFGVRNPFALSGTITGVDSQAHIVTVTVACGNRMVNPFIGQSVTLQTTAATRFLLRNADGTVTPINFDDLEAGQTVSTHGVLQDSTFTATRVTVGAELNCLP
jgi:hypothetical protein